MMVMLEYKVPDLMNDFDFITFTCKDRAEAFSFLTGFLVDVHIKSVKVLG